MSLNSSKRLRGLVFGCAFCVIASPVAWAQPAGDDEKSAKWKGTLDWSSKQPVPAGVQYFSGHLDLALDEDENGDLKGTLAGNQLQKLDVSTCPSDSISPGSVTARLDGKFAKQQVTINVADPSYTPPKMSPCPGAGPPATPPGIFRWPHFDEALRSLKAADEFHYAFDQEWTNPGRVYPYTVHYTFKMERSKTMRRDLDE